MSVSFSDSSFFPLSVSLSSRLPFCLSISFFSPCSMAEQISKPKRRYCVTSHLRKIFSLMWVRVPDFSVVILSEKQN